VQVRLAQPHRPGRHEPPDRRGIRRRRPVGERPGPAGGRRALDVQEVLDAEGPAGQGQPVAALDAGIDRPGLPPGQVRRERDERPELALVALDPGQRLPDHILREGPPGPDVGGHLGTVERLGSHGPASAGS
jgi:hypothetical protein